MLYFKADVNLRDSLGRHALHLAAEAGSVASVRFLVTDVGVNVNLQTVSTHNTSLHFAAKVVCDHFSDFSHITVEFIMVALWNRADHYIFALWFLSFFLSFFLA